MPKSARKKSISWEVIKDTEEYLEIAIALRVFIVRVPASEAAAKKIIVGAIEKGLVRLASPLTFQEADKGEPHLLHSVWQKKPVFRTFAFQVEKGWVKCSKGPAEFLQLDTKTFSSTDGWTIIAERTSWARGDIVAIKPSQLSSKNSDVGFGPHPPSVAINGEIASQPKIRRIAMDVRLHRQDFEKFLAEGQKISKGRKLIVKRITGARIDEARYEAGHITGVAAKNDKEFDWKPALSEIEELLRAGKMHETFGPIDGSFNTRDIAQWLIDRTTNALGHRPAPRTARTRALRIIDKWRAREGAR